MFRLYYLSDDIVITKAISDALHKEGITDWNFHVLAKDEAGLYQHHIHSATTYQQLDIVHTGEQWALIGGCIGLLLGLLVAVAEVAVWPSTAMTVGLFVAVGFLFGAWQGSLVGWSRESYKIESFHEDIEAGMYLIMVDVNADSKAPVREIMNMGFPQIRYCGKDSPLINPFKRAKKIHALSRA